MAALARAWRIASSWVPPVVYLGIIFLLSSQSHPLPFLPSALFSYDKVLHALEYAALGALIARALRGFGWRPWPVLVAAVVAASAYGASDEWHQSFVPNRSADPRDWIADTAGGALGAAAAAGFLRRRRSQASIP